MKIEIGIVLPQIGRHVGRDEVTGAIDVVEAAGFHTAWVSDHVALPEEISSVYPYDPEEGADLVAASDFWDSFTILSYAAGRTTRIRLGFGVLLMPLRHPLVTGRQIATLDNLSAGRVTVGAGAGWLREEFDVLDIPFEGRGAAFDDGLGIWQRMWSEDLVAATDGAFVFPPVGTRPRPPQQPSPPLLVGGHSKTAMRRAIRHRTGWIASPNSTEHLAEMTRTLKSLDEHGVVPSIAAHSGATAFRVDWSDEADAKDYVRAWSAAGADHVLLNLAAGTLANFSSTCWRISAALDLHSRAGVLEV
jgi:probable F420-dependent oxidoreductase